MKLDVYRVLNPGMSNGDANYIFVKSKISPIIKGIDEQLKYIETIVIPKNYLCYLDGEVRI
jgi:hypothetical protein